jgi:hypothetical protein
MTRNRWALFVLSLGLLTAPSQAAEFRDLFDGKTLDGWVAEGPKDYKEDGKTLPNWSVKDELIHCAGHGYGFLRYDKEQFSDFALHVEYRMAKNCNSGIGIRTVPYDPAKSTETRPSYACYEVQLLDDAGKPADKHGSGSLYRYVAPKENPVKPAPEWNAIDIECVGPKIKISINDKEVLNVDQSTIDEIKNKPLKGYVCLQLHGGVIDFRNVRIREIKADSGK